MTTKPLKTFGMVALLIGSQGCSNLSVEPPEVGEGGLAPLHMAAPGRGIDGSYIVVFKPDGPDDAAATIVSAAGITARYVYRHALNGFAATLDGAELKAIRENPDVAFVEQNHVVSTQSTVQPVDEDGQPWGLDRIDQRDLPLSNTYTYRRVGRGVFVYVLDTGISPDLDEFKKANGVSRAQVVYDAFGGDGLDCNGHGTHVAGIIGSNTYGVAKEVKLRSLRVLDCDGSGPVAAVIAGVDFVIADYLSRDNPAVANLSLIGPFSPASNLAIDILFQAGVLPVVAAGNDDDYACRYSPASALGAVTVAASTIDDAKSPFSNWGRCVHIYAPGSDIKSVWFEGGTAVGSGTSQAAPHASGVAALLLHKTPDLSAFQLRKQIVKRGSDLRITDNDALFYQYGTPNVLLHKGSL